MSRSRTHNTDCPGSYKSNYHTILTMTDLRWKVAVDFIDIGGIVDRKPIRD
jgi:hypothetical protein